MIDHNAHYPEDDLAMTRLPPEFHAMMLGLEQIFGAMDKPKAKVICLSHDVDPNDMLHGQIEP